MTNNIDALNELLSETATVIVKGKKFTLKRPDGAKLQKILRKEEELNAIDFLCQCIHLCMPDLTIENVMSLVALEGLQKEGALKEKVMEFCGLNVDKMKEAYDAAAAGGDADPDFLSQENSE